MERRAAGPSRNGALRELSEVMSHRRGPAIVVAVALGLVLGGLGAMALPAAARSGSVGPTSASIPSSWGNLTTVLNLQNGQDFVSPEISYNSYETGINTSFPVLLDSTAASAVGFLNESVLELAPQLTDLYGHDTGLTIFPSANSTQWEISADAVTSAEFNGDGASFYFLLSPTSTANWTTAAYVAAIPPGGSGLAECSGDLIFPYSTTPYVVVQWEPAYQSAWCGIGSVGEYNVFAVTPGANGVVTPSSIAVVGPIGENTSNVPSVHDLFNLTVAYEKENNSIQATAFDVTSSEVLADVAYNLSAVGFTPSPGAQSPYLGVAESASERTAWGLNYVAYATSFAAVNTTPPPPGPSPRFTANFTTEVDLNGGHSDLASGLVYGGTSTTFPQLLNNSTAGAAGFGNRSVLELAPGVVPPSDNEGLAMFAARNSSQWEVSADAVHSNGTLDGSVDIYFMLTPTTSTNWSTQYYLLDAGALLACSSEVVLPYSTTPYFVVQWNPASSSSSCGSGSGVFDVYSVNPEPDGLVWSGSISGAVGPVGTVNLSASAPGPSDVFNVTVGYKVSVNEMEARVVDATTGQELAYASLNMVNDSYRPPAESSIPSDLAVGASGGTSTAWGLQFAGYTTWTEAQNTSSNATDSNDFLTPPASTPSTTPPSLGSNPAGGSGPGGIPLAAVAVGLVVLAIVALAVLTLRRRQLRREGEELVAGMNRVISDAGVPPRAP